MRSLLSRGKRLLEKERKRLRQLFRPILIEINTRLGIPIRFHSPGRVVLENTILPYYANSKHGARVLFVGCDWYTAHYRKIFKNSEYWTIDPNPAQKRYGSKHHIVGSIENLKDHFEPEFFDVILCNGVLGFGLNQLEAAERAFNNCFTCLQRGGDFMLGRDEVEMLVPFSIEDMESLRKFVPFVFPPLKTARYTLRPGFNYLFCFFVKPLKDVGKMERSFRRANLT